ncbi:hypothetical protein ACP70R_038192 [Stipagrostis hirtigluma subsp. patula]
MQFFRLLYVWSPMLLLEPGPADAKGSRANYDTDVVVPRGAEWSGDVPTMIQIWRRQRRHRCQSIRGSVRHPRRAAPLSGTRSGNTHSPAAARPNRLTALIGGRCCPGGAAGSEGVAAPVGRLSDVSAPATGCGCPSNTTLDGPFMKSEAPMN